MRHGSLVLSGPQGQETKREVGDALTDIAEGLELSKHLQSLADGHWKECPHSGGLPLQGILLECARRISDQVQCRRRELEGSGRVHFGSVVLEVSDDSHVPPPATSPQDVGPPFSASHSWDPADRFLSGTSPAAPSMGTEHSTLEPLRRMYAALVASSARRGPKWFAMGPKQGGS